MRTARVQWRAMATVAYFSGVAAICGLRFLIGRIANPDSVAWSGVFLSQPRAEAETLYAAAFVEVLAL